MILVSLSPERRAAVTTLLMSVNALVGKRSAERILQLTVEPHLDLSEGLGEKTGRTALPPENSNVLKCHSDALGSKVDIPICECRHLIVEVISSTRSGHLVIYSLIYSVDVLYHARTHAFQKVQADVARYVFQECPLG